MKQLSLVVFILFFYQITALSQPCLPEGITFTTQAEIDNFQTNYPNCTEIEGDVTISGNDITNLNGLSVLTAIGESLFIGHNNTLINLTGLENLSSIGGHLNIWANDTLTGLAGLHNVTSIGESLFIGHNNAIINLTGLENLTSIGGYLNIWANNALTSLTGLDNIGVASIVNLFITDNYSLSNCEVQSICNYLANPNGTVNIYGNATGCNNPPEVANACGITLPCLPYGNYYFHMQTEIDDFQINYTGCTELEGFVRICGNNITNLRELNVITTIGGSLYIWHNDSLTSLTGMENVTSIGGELSIVENEALLSLTELENIDANSISDLFITDNSSLSTCEVQSICDYLTNPNGVIEIHDNDTGCNSQIEVEEACESVWVPNINVESEFLIYPNPANKELFISGKNGTIIKEVTIFNQIGQKVLHKKRITNTIDVSKLRQGMYIIELITNDFRIREKLIIR
jgi:hypothetical protein